MYNRLVSIQCARRVTIARVSRVGAVNYADGCNYLHCTKMLAQSMGYSKCMTVWWEWVCVGRGFLQVDRVERLQQLPTAKIV